MLARVALLYAQGVRTKGDILVLPAPSWMCSGTLTIFAALLSFRALILNSSCGSRYHTQKVSALRY